MSRILRVHMVKELKRFRRCSQRYEDRCLKRTGLMLWSKIAPPRAEVALIYLNRLEDWHYRCWNDAELWPQCSVQTVTATQRATSDPDGVVQDRKISVTLFSSVAANTHTSKYFRVVKIRRPTLNFNYSCLKVPCTLKLWVVEIHSRTLNFHYFQVLGDNVPLQRLQCLSNYFVAEVRSVDAPTRWLKGISEPGSAAKLSFLCAKSLGNTCVYPSVVTTRLTLVLGVVSMYGFETVLCSKYAVFWLSVL